MVEENDVFVEVDQAVEEVHELAFVEGIDFVGLNELADERGCLLNLDIVVEMGLVV